MPMNHSILSSTALPCSTFTMHLLLRPHLLLVSEFGNIQKIISGIDMHGIPVYHNIVTLVSNYTHYAHYQQ